MTSLENVTIKISNTNFDTNNQNMNFNIQLKSNPSVQTIVYASATLSECTDLNQQEIIDLIWSRAATQCVSWLKYVNRKDLNLSGLSGTVYTPRDLTIPSPPSMNYSPVPATI